MSYWKDYNNEWLGIPTGKIYSPGADQAKEEKRRLEQQGYNNNNRGNSGGNGCGNIILIGIALYVFISVLPIAIPAAISAVILGITINKFGDKILSIPYLLTFKQAFKSVFYTYLWYILVSVVVGFISIIFINPMLEMDQIEYSKTSFLKLGLKFFVLQIPIFLITGAIFRRYLSKYLGKTEVSYWRSTFLMSFALIVWFVMTGIGYYFLAEYNPDLFQQITEKVKEIYQ